MSEIRASDCSKSTINWKNDYDITISRHHTIVKSRRRVPLFKFSCWYKFPVNVMTGSGGVTIFVYNGFDQKLGIGNTTV